MILLIVIQNLVSYLSYIIRTSLFPDGFEPRPPMARIDLAEVGVGIYHAWHEQSYNPPRIDVIVR